MKMLSCKDLPRPNSISSLFSSKDGPAPGTLHGVKLTPIVPIQNKNNTMQGNICQLFYFLPFHSFSQWVNFRNFPFLMIFEWKQNYLGQIK